MIGISNVLKLVSPIGVSVNHYLKIRNFLIYKDGKPIPQSTLYETKEAKDYKKKFIKHIKEQVKLQGWKKSDNRFQKHFVDCVFYFPRIDIDSNNMYKLLLDSLTESECIWIDDTQSCERTQGIFYDSVNPRIEITITYTDYIGIFKDISQLEQFESNCIYCARYNRNCSILKKAKEGRIQEEINDLVCSKFKIKKAESQKC